MVYVQESASAMVYRCTTGSSCMYRHCDQAGGLNPVPEKATVEFLALPRGQQVEVACWPLGEEARNFLIAFSNAGFSLPAQLCFLYIQRLPGIARYESHQAHFSMYLHHVEEDSLCNLCPIHGYSSKVCLPGGRLHSTVRLQRPRPRPGASRI
jgi:hypothetical protein